MDRMYKYTKQVLFLLLVLLIATLSVNALNASFVFPTNSSLNYLSYDSGSESYADGSTTNDNLFIRVCPEAGENIAGMYARLEYRVGTSIYPVSIMPVQILNNVCTVLDLDFSEKTSVYPARPTIVLSSNSNFPSADYSYIFPKADGWLNGSFDFNYTLDSSNIYFTVLSAYDETNTSILFNKSALVVGVLNDLGVVTDSGITSLNVPLTLSRPSTVSGFVVNRILMDPVNISPIVSPPGGGGGGGMPSCNPQWVCGPWSDCINGEMFRDCIDDAGCDSNLGIPELVLDCHCVPQFDCTPWSDCNNGVQKRVCDQSNECIDSRYPHPTVRRTCAGDDPSIMIYEVYANGELVYDGSEVTEVLVYDDLPFFEIVVLNKGFGDSEKVKLKVTTDAMLLERIAPKYFSSIDSGLFETFRILTKTVDRESKKSDMLLTVIDDESSDSVIIPITFVKISTQEPMNFALLWFLGVLVLIPIFWPKKILVLDANAFSSLKIDIRRSPKTVFTSESVFNKELLGNIKSLKTPLSQEVMFLMEKYDIFEGLAKLLVSIGGKRATLITSYRIPKQLAEDYHKIEFLSSKSKKVRKALKVEKYYVDVEKIEKASKKIKNV